MNKYQRFILIFTALSLVLMFLFPPVGFSDFSGVIGYTFYLNELEFLHSILFKLLILQMATVTTIGLLLCLAFKSETHPPQHGDTKKEA